MLTHPGKKLLMMGSEFGQWNEWHYEQSLDWHLLEEEASPHLVLQSFFKTANAFYLEQRALWEQDFSWESFTWLCADDKNGNCVAFLRQDRKGKFLLVLCNFSPVHRKDYRVGVPVPGRYEVLLNTDDSAFGGAALGDKSPLKSDYIPYHEREQSILVDLPPLSAVILTCTKKFPPRRNTTSSQKKRTTDSGSSKR